MRLHARSGWNTFHILRNMRLTVFYYYYYSYRGHRPCDAVNNRVRNVCFYRAFVCLRLITRQIQFAHKYAVWFRSHSLFMAIKGNDVIVPLNWWGMWHKHTVVNIGLWILRQVVWVQTITLFDWMDLNGKVNLDMIRY